MDCSVLFVGHGPCCDSAVPGGFDKCQARRPGEQRHLDTYLCISAFPPLRVYAKCPKHTSRCASSPWEKA
eukprot:6794730-Alexandrium_andersonii.AAC.1